MSARPDDSGAILRAISLALLLAIVAACGAESDSAEEPECPTTTTAVAAPSTTTTIDPRCVSEADEQEEEDEATSGPDEWTGTLHSVGNAGGCLATWNGEISLTVQSDGEVAGDAGISTSGQPGCTVIGGAAGTPYDEEFAVQGRLSGATFDLEFIDPTESCLALVGGGASIICWGVPGGSVEHDGDTVADTFSIDLGPTTFDTTLELACDTC